MDHAQSFRISDSKSFEFDDQTALEHIDPTVAACERNVDPTAPAPAPAFDDILTTVRREDWYKVSGIHIIIYTM
jgi:hypothetical protein